MKVRADVQPALKQSRCPEFRFQGKHQLMFLKTSQFPPWVSSPPTSIPLHFLLTIHFSCKVSGVVILTRKKNYKGKCWHENWKGNQHKQMQQKILCSLCNRGKIPYEPIMPNITYFISHVYSKTQIVLDDCTQIQQWQYTLENEQSIIDQIRF